MYFSLVIPTYEYKNRAPELLNTLLSSISQQTMTDYEIVVSDHSTSDLVKEYISLHWSSLPIKYSKNIRGVGNSSVNMNEGIKLSDGKFIKIMHMDDWFCNDNTLFLIKEAVEGDPKKKWGGVGFNHYYEDTNSVKRYIMPHIDSQIRTLLGCPSVSFFINDKADPIFFDESIIIINDSDMHIRLGKRYGAPALINEYCVTVRMSKDQVSSTVTSQHHLNEISYYRNKNF